ncbi:hypothetical protein QTA56_07615 [Acinetobacter sp. VNH17]|uniref:Phage tail protein n=1 Tax=Acinetobacter thutiue TaxID=2998078 RepID=A0ABT7WN51_9GAMM|nr:hypothetical protein [Acinetobacter thutiue]MCY6411999.1 hypothetical protein [Acinetobacter thutiue]MDN0014103.1 hypothetical protein [Acinetobacter thutiue]
MKRIDSINARPNANGAGKTGFHDNADLSGQDATYLTPDFMNHLQEELCNLLEMNGIALNSGVRDQLYQLLATNADIDALATATQVKLDQEQTWRTDADNWLQQQINNEQVARQNADTYLDNGKYNKSGGDIGGDVRIVDSKLILFHPHPDPENPSSNRNELLTQIYHVDNYTFPYHDYVNIETNASAFQFNKPINAPNLNMLGVSQSWYDMTSQRAFSEIYTNDTGKPIQVNAAVHGYELDGVEYVAADVNSVLVDKIYGHSTGGSYYGTYNFSFIVPAGANYQIYGTTRDILYWSELR